jgi:hypothetical protein
MVAEPPESMLATIKEACQYLEQQGTLDFISSAPQQSTALQ